LPLKNVVKNLQGGRQRCSSLDKVLRFAQDDILEYIQYSGQRLRAQVSKEARERPSRFLKNEATRWHRKQLEAKNSCIYCLY
jgi:hypothetical protein